MPQKSTRSTRSPQNETGEYETFVGALRKVLSVPRSQIKAELDAEKKRARKRHPKRASSHVSGDKD